MESANSTSTTAFSGPRIPELDGIRGIAILLVVIWHYFVYASIPLDSWGLRILGATWSGVDLFFVLSGLLIGGLLLDHREATNYYKVFYLRRIHRIVPLYFAWLVLFMLFRPVLVRVSILEPIVTPSLPLLSYFTFTQNFLMAIYGNFGAHWLGITWSLAVEEQFYLTLPLLIRLIPAKRLPWMLCLLISLAFVMRWLYVSVSGKSLGMYVLMPCRADALLLGVLAAYMIRRPKLKSFLLMRTTWLYAAFSILLILSLWMSYQYPGDITTFIVSVYGYTLLALMYFTFVLIAITETKGVVKSLTRSGVFQFLGLHAYGIYLFHQTINMILHGLLLRKTPAIQTPLDVLVTFLALSVTLSLAYLSWTYFEKPLVVRGHRYKYHLPLRT